MTNSELFVLMASGMAHISGGLMAVYISYGADPVAVHDHLRDGMPVQSVSVEIVFAGSEQAGDRRHRAQRKWKSRPT